MHAIRQATLAAALGFTALLAAAPAASAAGEPEGALEDYLAPAETDDSRPAVRAAGPPESASCEGTNQPGAVPEPAPGARSCVDTASDTLWVDDRAADGHHASGFVHPHGSDETLRCDNLLGESGGWVRCEVPEIAGCVTFDHWAENREGRETITRSYVNTIHQCVAR